MTKRIMEDFAISEISAVDRPAQKGAKMTIMKRDFSTEERERMAETGAAMPDGGFPIVSVEDLKNAIHAIGRAKDPAAAKEHIIRRARALGQTELLPEGWVSKSAGNGNQPGHEGEKLMDELQKKIDEAVKAATTDLTKRAEQAEARAVALLKMSKEEREHLDDLDDDDKEEFLRASAADRKAKMKKRAEDDPVIYKSADGTEFRKSDDPRWVSLAKRADEAEKVAKAEHDARELSDLKKRAGDEFGRLPGTVEAKANVLKALGGLDEEVRKSVETIFATAEKMAKSGFGMVGTLPGKAAGSDTPEGQLQKRAEEIQKAENVSFAKAYDKACQENPHLYEQIATPTVAAPQ